MGDVEKYKYEAEMTRFAYENLKTVARRAQRERDAARADSEAQRQKNRAQMGESTKNDHDVNRAESARHPQLDIAAEQNNMLNEIDDAVERLRALPQEQRIRELRT